MHRKILDWFLSPKYDERPSAPRPAQIAALLAAFTYTFELDPTPHQAIVVPKRATPSALEAIARRQLTAGDGHSALRIYSALIRALPEANGSCWWRLGALRATRAIEPWGGRRVEAAARAFHEAAQRGYPQSSRCLDRAASEIEAIATQRHRLFYLGRDTLLRQAVHWYRLALDSWSKANREHRLRYYLADALDMLGEHEAAARNYAQAAEDPGGKYYDEAKKMLRYYQQRGRR